jgi:hypothetical protein
MSDARERLETRAKILEAHVDELRELADNALIESTAITPAFERVVAKAEAGAKNSNYRQLVGNVLARRGLFYNRLSQYQNEVREELGLLKKKFERLGADMTPVLEAQAQAADREPSLEERLHLKMLELQMQGFNLRRDIGMTLIESPRDAAVIAMNDATHVLIGKKRHFALDFHELADDAVNIAADLVVPGTSAIAAILKQFKDRTLQAAERLGDAIGETDRMFEFAELAEKSLAVLEDWRMAAQMVSADLGKIADVELPNFLHQLRANYEGKVSL